jgi:hypothetical protein
MNVLCSFVLYISNNKFMFVINNPKKTIYDYFQENSAKIFFICMIYPVYWKEKLNWPSLPRWSQFKGIDECIVFLCIVHLWFRFFTLLPRFLLLVIKGQFFPRTKILFPSAFFFTYKNVASKSFLKYYWNKRSCLYCGIFNTGGFFFLIVLYLILTTIALEQLTTERQGY